MTATDRLTLADLLTETPATLANHADRLARLTGPLNIPARDVLHLARVKRAQRPLTPDLATATAWRDDNARALAALVGTYQAGRARNRLRWADLTGDRFAGRPGGAAGLDWLPDLTD